MVPRRRRWPPRGDGVERLVVPAEEEAVALRVVPHLLSPPAHPPPPQQLPRPQGLGLPQPHPLPPRRFHPNRPRRCPLVPLLSPPARARHNAPHFLPKQPPLHL